YENTILPDNLPALIYAAKVARTPYMTPAGPDVINLVTESATLSATVTDTRYNNSNGTEPTQTIAGAEYYIDIPPWSATATPIALTAADGSFDSDSEAVSATIDVSNLAPGEHIVYVRGKDADGNWGPVTAEFLTGSLKVTISPQGAVDAGAQWQADSGAWQDSGAVVPDLDGG
ncbi:MAG: carboxypeptidase, partial [Desulfobacterales bacterium]|nr:carboxypeptidase [Desulfobacterales bacterium]